MSQPLDCIQSPTHFDAATAADMMHTSLGLAPSHLILCQLSGPRLGQSHFLQRQTLLLQEAHQLWQPG